MSAEYWGRPARRSSLPDLDARCQLPDLITICRTGRANVTTPTSRDANFQTTMYAANVQTLYIRPCLFYITLGLRA